MRITKRRLSFFAGLAGLVAISLGVCFLLRPEPAHAQQPPGFKVTGRLNVPGHDMAVTRMEDKETGIVCYFLQSGFFSCVKK